MAFCDFCDCDMCRTGEDGFKEPMFSHAQTSDGRWICDICYQYSVCISEQRKERSGGHNGPCPPGPCKHRPQIISVWKNRHGR